MKITIDSDELRERILKTLKVELDEEPTCSLCKTLMHNICRDISEYVIRLISDLETEECKMFCYENLKKTYQEKRQIMTKDEIIELIKNL